MNCKIKIDTTKRGEKKVELWISEKKVQEISATKDIVASIKELLQNNNLKPSDISEYIPNSGPGSFTGIKIGVTVANVLNWATRNKMPNSPYVPYYGSEPNISKPK